MGKAKLVIVFAAVVGIAAVMLGFWLFAGQTEDRAALEATAIDSASLGIIYLPVTRGLSEYYGLGVESGALVTEVTTGSPADQAGLQVGDVILSFNGARPEEPTPLLGMMMACPVGDRVTLEVWRGNSTLIVEFLHIEE